MTRHVEIHPAPNGHATIEQWTRGRCTSVDGPYLPHIARARALELGAPVTDHTRAGMPAVAGKRA